jgi:hypothetical protein
MGRLCGSKFLTEFSDVVLFRFASATVALAANHTLKNGLFGHS